MKLSTGHIASMGNYIEVQDRNCKADRILGGGENASPMRSTVPIYREIPGRGTLTTSIQDLWKVLIVTFVTIIFPTASKFFSSNAKIKIKQKKNFAFNERKTVKIIIYNIIKIQ